MFSSTRNYSAALGLLFCLALATTPVAAEKPSWAGGEKGHKSEQGAKGGAKNKQGGAQSDGVTVSAYFGDRQRSVIRDYYSDQFRAGHCPPGLAKKNNGCMPPGQAKKWAIGQRLPSDVIYYDLPSDIVVRLGAPPSGHRYVRVAADILLIAVGTSMVVDAIEDLASM